MVALFGAIVLSIPLGAVAQQLSSPEQRMAVLVNQARAAQGLPPLAVSGELTAAAAAHARDMVAQGYLEHEGRDGSTPHQRAIRHGYFGAPQGSPWYVVEVISARSTAEAALNFLLSDRLHRGVVMRPIWREMGLSYQEGGPTGHLWTIEFGCRPNVLPVIADATSSGGITLRLSNEECSPAGGNAQQIGRATQVMVSDRSDFNGAAWEPFAATKVVNGAGRNIFVRLRDERGREATASTNIQGSTLTAAAAIPPTSLPIAAILPDQPKSSAASEPEKSSTKLSSKKSKSSNAEAVSEQPSEGSSAAPDTSSKPVFDGGPPGLFDTATPSTSP